jgi:NAD(P)-dependent dehydrogenase (short-subunit alcohol dehydrogenase family)
VLISDRSGESTALARDLGPPERVAGAAADLSDAAAVTRLIDTVRERFGRLDALVNVAGGLSVIRPVAETTQEDWQNEVRRNAETVFLVSRAALPLLRESRGTIVNFASPAVGTRAARNLAAYGAAKAAVISLTHALAVEERDAGVRVNAVAPGTIDTEQNRAGIEHPDRVRWVTREQIADVVLFLSSAAGSGVNGEVVHVLADGVS